MKTAKEWDTFYDEPGRAECYLSPLRIGFYRSMADVLADYLYECRIEVRRTTLSVLDVGCGMGHFLKELQTRMPPQADSNGVAIQYAGCDISPHVIGIAATLLKDTLLMVTDFHKLGTPYKARYDVVTCFQVLEHLPNPVLSVEALIDLVIPGHSLFVTVPGPNNDADKSHLHHWTVETFKPLLEPYGDAHVMEIIKGAYILGQITIGGTW